jgi:hypothetical protein
MMMRRTRRKRRSGRGKSWPCKPYIYVEGIMQTKLGY